MGLNQCLRLVTLRWYHLKGQLLLPYHPSWIVQEFLIQARCKSLMMHKCPLRCSLIQPIPMRSLPSWLRMNVKTLRSLLDQKSATQNDLNQAVCSSCPLPKKIWKHIRFLHLKRPLLSLQEVHDLFLLFQKFYVKLGLSLSLLLLSTLLLRVPRPFTVPPNRHQLFPHLFLK